MYAHEDKNEWPWHEKFDIFIDARVMYAPRLSREMVLSVESMYYMGLSVDMVYERHMLQVREGLCNVENESTIDNFLT